jgi:hypothetical protein
MQHALERALGLAALLGMLLLRASPAGAGQERTRSVSGSRVELGEIAERAPARLAELDLGSSPQPGQTRLITREEVLRRIQQAGLSAGDLELPEAVRVTRPFEHWSTLELAERARPAIQQALAKGARLERVVARLPITVARGAVIERASLSDLPKRVGPAQLLATVELNEDEATSKRLTLTVEVYVDEQGARHDLTRGSEVKLVIERKSATVTAVGEALSDADVGQIIQFRVRTSGKLLRAIVESPHHARVL